MSRLSSKGVVVLLALVGAGLLLVSAFRPWVTGAVDDVLGATRLSATGAEVAPGLTAVALAIGAAAIAIVAAGDRWDDGSLRPNAADQLVAGRVVDELADLGIDFHSPACAAACAAAVALRGATEALIAADAATGQQTTDRTGAAR